MKNFSFLYNRIIISLIAILMCSAMIGFAQSNQQNSTTAKGFKQRTLLQKQAHAKVLLGYDRRHIQVKFKDDLDLEIDKASGIPKELSKGLLKSTKAQSILGKVASKGGRWMPMSPLSKDKMNRLRANAERALNRELANMSNYYILAVPDGVSAEEWMDELNSLDEVEIASPVPIPVPTSAVTTSLNLTTAPDYEPQQGYLNSAPGGIGARYAWGIPGGKGKNTTICVFEYSWNSNHQDLPSGIDTLLPYGYTALDPNPDANIWHGTAVLGEMVSKNNGWGTTGAAYEATAKVAPILSQSDSGQQGLTTAINYAIDHLMQGDVLLIAQGVTNNLPVEWDYATYEAILLAVGNGIHVVEAAGNGGHNLDDPEFSTDNNGHYPFLPQNNSGAIMVGAGYAPGGPETDLSWKNGTNYGSRVDLQGWGNNIVTTGGGNLYSNEGPDYYYTNNFGATSGAVPMIASAVAILESIHEQKYGSAVSPAEMRELLVRTGSPQQGDLSKHIGPRPNIEAAITLGHEGKKVAVILIQFKDAEHGYYKGGNRSDGYLTADFDSMLFSYNYWKTTATSNPHPEGDTVFGSLRDYWDQVSCGKLQITGEVVNPTNSETDVPLWLVSDHDWSYYKDHQPENDLILANEAITKAKNAGWISETIGGPNYYDKYIIIFSGNAIRKGSISTCAQTISGKFIQIYERTGWMLDRNPLNKRQNDGDPVLDDYTEYAFCHIGVPIHEFSHLLGRIDLYIAEGDGTYKSQNDPLTYTLMSAGMYNGPIGKGECPATLSPYERISMGWVAPTLINQDRTNLLVEYNYENPQYFKIIPPHAPSNGSVREHYIIESRGREGFDKYLPNNYSEFGSQNGRLLIWHNDILMADGSNPEKEYYRTAVIPADGIWDSTTFVSDFFPKTAAAQNFNATTTPKAVLGHPFLQNDRPATFALNGIHRESSDNNNTVIDNILLHEYTDLSLGQEWSLVSVPRVQSNDSASVVFPSKFGEMFAYDPLLGDYVESPRLSLGLGYWVFYKEADTISINGTAANTITIACKKGWNLIGSREREVKVADLQLSAGSIYGAVFRFNNSINDYAETTVLIPGEGVWIFVTADCNLTIP